ncbi:YqhA family protein [Hydrogenimonas cancrithermarum]|uniref:Membrane protein n=1 Tax=Hydrogenimonas cancrithermarum TaxID=2993563 RepID=A0ABN6WTU1_9BACT|nr:YqhA family protein [Hydrogenimonas cancrithermarum]BDY12469.1 membrane protein [Hydrogenimonas cancrithermarum]
MKFLEKLFETTLWNGRLFVLLAVIFSMLGAIALFVVASTDIWGIVVKTFQIYFSHAHPEHFHEELVGVIIGAVDLYLMAIVMLIFSFGVYELFISEIDPAKDVHSGSKILEIHTLDELKDKLAKVIVMVLVVSFFKKALYTHYSSPLEMLYFAGAILALSLGLYFLHKGGNH